MTLGKELDFLRQMVGLPSPVQRLPQQLYLPLSYREREPRS